MPYTHRPLESIDSIRLLILLSGTKDDRIECALSNHRLGSCPPYQAVSYRWGNAEPTAVISIEGDFFCIRPHLYQFLQQTRSASSPVVLWIDAICIDQAGTADKTHQVQLMGSIYAKAESVIIWLGDGDEESAAAMDILGHEDVGQDLSSGSHEEWLALHTLLGKQEYWSRIWIVQELVLAESIMIHWGDKVLPWQHLEDFLTNFRTNATVATLEDFLNEEELLAAKLWRRRRQGLITPFRDLIVEHRFSHCTDPRDKIYALRSLASDHNIGKFPVDYAKSLTDIYWDTVRFCNVPPEQAWNFDLLLVETLDLPYGEAHSLRPDYVTLDIRDHQKVAKALGDAMRHLFQREYLHEKPDIHTQYLILGYQQLLVCGGRDKDFPILTGSDNIAVHNQTLLAERMYLEGTSSEIVLRLLGRLCSLHPRHMRAMNDARVRSLELAYRCVSEYEQLAEYCVILDTPHSKVENPYRLGLLSTRWASYQLVTLDLADKQRLLDDGCFKAQHGDLLCIPQLPRVAMVLRRVGQEHMLIGTPVLRIDISNFWGRMSFREDLYWRPHTLVTIKDS